MESLVVAVFEDEAAARAGARAMQELHAKGVVTLFASAIVMRDAALGGVIVREPLSDDEAFIAPAVGAFIGALVALLGGPLTAAVRGIDAAIVGAVRDLTDVGLDGSFLEKVSRYLRPGSAAVVVDVQEWSPVHFESSISALGGQTLRHNSAATAPDELVLRDIVSLRRSLRKLAKDQDGSDHVDAALAIRRSREAALHRSLRRAQALAATIRRQGRDKAMLMQIQATSLNATARRAVEKRAETMLMRNEERASRLDQMIEDRGGSGRRTAGSGSRRPGPKAK